TELISTQRTSRYSIWGLRACRRVSYLQIAADGDAGGGAGTHRCSLRLIYFDQPAQTIIAGAARLARLVGRGSATAAVLRRADTAIGLEGLRDPAQGIVLGLGNSIGRIAGGKVRIGDRGHTAQRIIGGGHIRGAAGGEMLGLALPPQAIVFESQ